MPPGQLDIDRGVIPTDDYWNDLTAAFEAAPDSFKDQLCSLDGVYIVENACTSQDCIQDVIKNSWGFRQPTQTPQRFIATSGLLWQGTKTAPALNDYETLRLKAVLLSLSKNTTDWYNPPAGSTP